MPGVSAALAAWFADAGPGTGVLEDLAERRLIDLSGIRILDTVQLSVNGKSEAASFTLVTLPVKEYPRLPELPLLAGTVDGGVLATEMVVFSAHGVAPAVHENSAARDLRSRRAAAGTSDPSRCWPSPAEAATTRHRPRRARALPARWRDRSRHYGCCRLPQ